MKEEAVMTEEVVRQLTEEEIAESMKHGYAVLDSVLTNALEEKRLEGYTAGFGNGFKFGGACALALAIGAGVGIYHIRRNNKKGKN